MMKTLSSLKIFFGLILIIVFVKILFIFFKPVYTSSTTEAEFSWLVIILAAVLGSISVKLSPVTGFPKIWDSSEPKTHYFLIPSLLGLFFGVIVILMDIYVPLGAIHIAFPLSIPYYLYGGIVNEIFYRLIPMVFLVWFISIVVLKKRWTDKVFWTSAILHSFIEPVLDTIGIYQQDITNEIFLFIYFLFKYASNLTPAYLFRKYGFLAAIVFRTSFYLIWHIIWGGLV